MTLPPKSYLLRVWLEPSAERAAWRASLTDLQTQEKAYFADAPTLLACLQHLLADSPEALS